MVARNYSRASEVTVEDYFWGRIAKGALQMLVQQGFACAGGPLPGDPGQKKTVARTTDPQGRAIRIYRATKNIFSVQRDWSEEEANWYRVTEKARRDKEQELERARRIVDSWPSTPEKFRADAALFVKGFTDAIERMLDSGQAGGYRLYDSDLEQVYELSDRLRELVQSGGIVMDPEARRRHIPACIADEIQDSAAAAAESCAPLRVDNVIQFRLPGR